MSEAGPSRSTAEIPIDPALLAEEEAEQALAEADFDQVGDQSSADDDSGGDEYVDDNEDGDDDGELERRPQAGSSQVDKEDAIFGRLAGYVSRAIPTGAKGGLGGREFQREIARADAEELPQVTNRRAVKPRRIHKPTHEVQKLLGQANMAYIQADHQNAIDLFLEVLRHDPYVLSAWTTLASCYSEQGDFEKATQMKFLAAHIDNDEESWRELAHIFKESGQQDQCVYCLRKALKQDPGDVGLLWELGTLYRHQKQRTRASDVYRKMLKLHPAFTHNFDLHMEYHSVFIETQQRSFIAGIMREAFDWHIDVFLSPAERERNHGKDQNTMTLERVIDLVEDMLQLEDLDQAVQIIRRGQRWLQARKSQKQWDTFEDDREYDPPGTQRQATGTQEMEDSEGFPLDLQLRHRLALSRLRLGNDEEALIHVSEILTLDVLQYHTLFVELGEALMAREMWEKALDCFASIQECEDLPDETTHIYSIGVCHHQLKSYAEASEALRWVVENDPENINARLRLANVLEDMGKKAEALDLVSEVIRHRAHREKDSHALHRSQLSQMEDPDTAAAAQHLNKAEKAANKRLTKRILEDQMRTQMQNLWQDVQDAERGIDQGELDALDRFIASAGTMVENYRLNRGNFSKSRGVVRIQKSRKSKARRNDLDAQALEMQDRLERVLGFEDDHPAEKGNEWTTFRRTEFYGLNYEEWLALMVKYCCVLMVKNEEDIAIDILEHVVWSGLFHNRRCEVALRLTIVSCAMRLEAYDKIVENCKRLSQLHQFLPLPLLLLLGSLSKGGLKAQAAWSVGSLDSYITREMKTHDDALPYLIADGVEEPPRVHYAEPTGRWAPNRNGGSLLAKDKEEEDWGEQGVEDEEGDGERARPTLPTKKSPYLNVLHAQQLLANKSYQSALFYLFRALEIDQYNPFICLLIAQAFFGRAMNRQSDNRNYQLAQGMAFLTRYRKLSPQFLEALEEVEYNYGRAFHSISVFHLAVQHFERLLSSVEKRMEASDDPEAVRESSLAYEAAHNLILIYATSGNQQLVKEKSKWLAI